MLEYLYSFLIGYFIGAVPFSYLTVKLFTGKIIYKEGSGNVGAMNSYEITQNKYIGILNGLLDVLKGFFAVLLSKQLFISDTFIAISFISAILGHNFSIFIKFRGGRGLATAAGGMLLIYPILVAFWLMFYFLSKQFISKNVHINSVLATFLLLIVIFFLSKFIYTNSLSIIYLGPGLFKLLFLGVFFLILVKHIEPLKDLIINK